MKLSTCCLFLFLSASVEAETKRVVVCTVTTGFRHSSIETAEETLQKLAKESGAYTIVAMAQQPKVSVPKKPGKPKDLPANADDKAKTRYEGEVKKFEAEMAKWNSEGEARAKAAQVQFDAEMKASMAKLDPAYLREQKIDGVIFASTTGDLPLPDTEGFLKWIAEGHAFMGFHSATDTFHKFPAYIAMIQGEFAGHGAQVPADLHAVDLEHPANGKIGSIWKIKQEEMYLFKNHNRDQARELWFMRNHPNKTEEKGFFPVSWCRNEGKGRVFYTSLGHREDLWSDSPELKGRINSVETSRQFQAHILGGMKWALGVAEGSSTPNPEVK